MMLTAPAFPQFNEVIDGRYDDPINSVFGVPPCSYRSESSAGDENLLHLLSEVGV